MKTTDSVQYTSALLVFSKYKEIAHLEMILPTVAIKYQEIVKLQNELSDFVEFKAYIY